MVFVREIWVTCFVAVMSVVSMMIVVSVTNVVSIVGLFWGATLAYVVTRISSDRFVPAQLREFHP